MVSRSTIWPGHHFPRGAIWDGFGVNFALFSAHAEKVELCLFDPAGRRELERIALPEHTDEVWHGYLPNARPGLLYGYRVHGPYARAYAGQLRWTDAHFGYRIGSPREDFSFDRRDNAAAMPKCVVVDPAFTWADHRRPATPWSETIIYEAHVKGLTKLHPDLPDQLKGTYAGIADPRVIEHLVELGITAIELMPVHAFLDDRHLVERGLRNYWGYNTIGFFAPETRYLSPQGRISEFKTMVRRLHAAGIEVILDVVYNHTAEGNHLGPTLSFKGIDNASYYRLVDDDPRYYMDVTGTGNTLDLSHHRVLQLVMDSLRYWAEDMQVDGFRFDLATTLGRDKHARFDPGNGFFNAIRQDPVLSNVKLIAEPWDVGYEGYRLGGHGPGFAEWNDRFRNTVRAFWKGDEGMTPDLAARLLGSSDLFEHQGRRSWATINFVTAHDGFTLEDVVSYDDKHNEANGEDNRDGHNDNLSWNWGVEGPTGDKAVLALRRQLKRNILATLLLAEGTPMLLMGDEVGRSQCGNNNAYCQDNVVSWLDWADVDADDRGLMRFVSRLIRLRRSHPVLHRNHFLHGRSVSPRGIKDATWLTPDGIEMTGASWQDARTRCLGLMLCGEASPDLTAQGAPLLDATLLILLNAHHEPVAFNLPDLSGQPWLRLLDTAAPQGRIEQHEPGPPLPLAARSLVVMRLIEPASADDELAAVERLGEAAVGVAFHAAQAGEPAKGVAVEPALAPLAPEMPR